MFVKVTIGDEAGVGGSPTSSMRTISYTYDGLNRLIGAAESPGTSYTYTYDLGGNRTGVWENGVPTQSYRYNAANQVVGWSYDAAGNLLSDGTTSSTWDALSRTLTRAGASYAYNGDGILTAQTIGGVTTRYTQDLAVPLPVILSDGSARYVYGHERLFGDAGSARTWYLGDALGSVRATLDDAGAPLAGARYDPWGAPVTAAIAPFGFTGELQQGNEVYLRARWYDSARGAFGSRDPFAGEPEQPYSLHPYQYGYAAPTIWTDPGGQCVAWGNRECEDIRTWADFVATFEYQLTITDAATAGRAAGTTPREMAEYAAWYSVIAPQAEQYALDDPRFLQAEVFASYLLHESLVMQRMRDPAVLIAERDYLDQLACQRDLTSSEAWRHLHILTILGGMQFAEDEAGGGGGHKGPSGRVSAQKYLEKRWDRATFNTVEQSISYHVKKHGKGLSIVEYTQRAEQAFRDPLAQRLHTTDLQGRPAVKVFSDTWGNGLYTKQGKIIWFHPKN